MREIRIFTIKGSKGGIYMYPFWTWMSDDGVLLREMEPISLDEAAESEEIVQGIKEAMKKQVLNG